MKKIYLVRHCKATGQEAAATLTEEGMSQSEKVADFFQDKSIDYIVASPYERAVLTIRPFAERSNLTIQLDPRLQERVLSAEDRPDWMELDGSVGRIL